MEKGRGKTGRAQRGTALTAPAGARAAPPLERRVGRGRRGPEGDGKEPSLGYGGAGRAAGDGRERLGEVGPGEGGGRPGQVLRARRRPDASPSLPVDWGLGDPPPFPLQMKKPRPAAAAPSPRPPACSRGAHPGTASELRVPALRRGGCGDRRLREEAAPEQAAAGPRRSTVGALLASELGWKFYDADDYHPEENRRKMGKGIPLNDQDRIPWLCNLHDILLRDVASGQRVVLACSALKKTYRDILTQGKDGVALKCEESGKEAKQAEMQLLVVHLSGSFEVISGRLLKREGHFMPPELLQSQFETLEPPAAPENFIQISVDKNVSEIIATIMETLKMK
ncbi:putative gluconokinase isoform X1 [Homo sapiens]|nr:probable gluconokinase isoform X1 [Homo sapiens]